MSFVHELFWTSASTHSSEVPAVPRSPSARSGDASVLGEDALPVEGREGAVFHLMRRVMQLHAARWAAVVPEMTKAQWSVMHAVADDPENDQVSIGERTAIDKATLVPLVGRLVERGWLVRETDPADRRRRRVALTEAGRDALRRAAPLVDEVDATTLTALSPGEQEQLRGLLTRLV